MPTLQDSRPTPTPSDTRPRGPADHRTALARAIAALLPDSFGSRCPALDIAVLGVPGHEHRLTLPLVGPDSDLSPGSGSDSGPGVSLRLYAGKVIVAATPGRPGPCPRCLERRWTARRTRTERWALDDPFGVRASDAAPPPSHLAPMLAALVEAAVEPVTGPMYPVWEVATGTASVREYGLLRDSSCTCAEPAEDTAEDARVTLRPALASRPGGTRSRAPEDLGLPMDALANPVCGMLGGPALRAYHATATAPVSGYFEVRSKYGLHEMWWSGHAESYRLSELLGALEGLERDAGQRPRRTTVARRAAVAELGVPHVEMEECGVYSEDFYERHPEQYVRWSEHPSVPWVWGWSLRDDRALLVPEQLVYYLDHREDHRNTVQECSNGCASGSSVTEAVLHGLLELIERDAFLIQWYGGLTPAEIDLDTVGHPLVRQMRAHLGLLGYDLRCFDIRVDLPVPAVGAVAVRRDGGPGTLCFAGGASLDPADAVRAAVCEVASYVPGFEERVTSAREHNERMVADYGAVTELEHHARLFGMPEMAPHAAHWLRRREARPLSDLYAGWTAGRDGGGDLCEPVREIVGLLADRGLDTVAVDQTTPEQRALGLTTVATLVPGLVPIDFGWRRQRALTLPRTRWAPYEAGLVERPLTAEQLHLVPHPFP
ncbi:TOMM precursor leader peptide-binding protein [Streptomyces sp. NPDC048172]|uniref:TOMM precursor leader peptide-binding protein n=1 Tax=Streptomyces sp. NPDC048172 TaxID=3365505 RepID=UPI00371AAC58